MASSANSPQGGGRVLTDRLLRQKLANRRRDNGDIPDGAADRIIAKHLEKGRGGIAAGVVNRINKPNNPYGSGNPLAALNPGAFTEEPDLAGMRGLKMNRGDVYYGSTAREVPRTSTRTVNGGYSSTPGRTEITPLVMPRGFAGSAARAPEQSSPSNQSSGPSRDLLNARAAYDAQQSEGGSAANAGSSPSWDLGATGGDLYNAIAGQGQGQIDTYKQRFIPRLLANANLTAQEIGYAGQQAIDNLPDDLNLADYEDPFRKGSGPRKKQSLFDFLSSQITSV